MHRLAELIGAADGLQIHQAVETNIVIFRVDPGAYSVAEFLGKLKDAGVLAVPFGPSLVRMVTHLDVSADAIKRAGEAVRSLKPR